MVIILLWQLAPFCENTPRIVYVFCDKDEVADLSLES